MKAIRIHEVGGPEVLKYEECPTPIPGRGEVRVDVRAVGVNFTDVNTRKGVNPPASLPMTPGREAAGVVSAVGEGVTEVKVGDPVVYCSVTGSYAEQVVVPGSVLVRIPDGMDARTAAGVLLQGMTAHFLAHSAYPLKPGDTALVHAGAGGTGLLLIQMAKRAGARVFATVSTEEKAAVARDAGADRAIIYTREDFEQEVKEATDGRGVEVVYDSVGKVTLEKSLNCVAPPGIPGAVRFRQRAGAHGEHGAPGQRFGIPDPSHPGRLRQRPSGASKQGWRGAGVGGVGRAEGTHRRGPSPLPTPQGPTASSKDATPPASSCSSRSRAGPRQAPSRCRSRPRAETLTAVGVSAHVGSQVAWPVFPVLPAVVLLVPDVG